ncbi:MAG: MBL fold metallo-hydrolase [Aeromicrobium sp.]
MRVDVLNCAVMNNLLIRPQLCAVVLLCHTDAGLVLVDSGLGTADLAEPERRLGLIRFLQGADRDARHTALSQVKAAGHAPEDVTHIVLTHLDNDHVGGIADFPGAVVHTTADEYRAAVTDPDWRDKVRYRPAQWDHEPDFRTHEGRGDVWKHDLTGHEVLPGITLIPMPGHSRGHAVVAVDTGERSMIIHSGDAVFDASSYAKASPSGRPLRKLPSMRAFESVVGRDHRAIRENHRTLAGLNNQPGVTVIPAHDKRILEDLQGRT